jgi:DNA-binding MarR family transcriptional regulator
VTDAIDEIDEQFLVALRRSRSRYQQVAESVAPGLEPGAYAFLVRLGTDGPARPSDLAAYFRIGKATAGRQLASLEQLHLVSRRPDPEDGRAHLLALTDEGKERLKAARAQRRLALHERLSAWPQSDLEALARLLARLNADLPE